MRKPTIAEKKKKTIKLEVPIHKSRKVIFVSLYAELLDWAESVGLSSQQATHLTKGFEGTAEDNEAAATWVLNYKTEEKK